MPWLGVLVARRRVSRNRRRPSRNRGRESGIQVESRSKQRESSSISESQVLSAASTRKALFKYASPHFRYVCVTVLAAFVARRRLLQFRCCLVRSNLSIRKILLCLVSTFFSPLLHSLYLVCHDLRSHIPAALGNPRYRDSTTTT